MFQEPSPWSPKNRVVEPGGLAVDTFKPCTSGARVSFSGLKRKNLCLVANSAKTKGAAVFSTVAFTLCKETDKRMESPTVFQDGCTRPSARAFIRLIFSCRKGGCRIHQDPRCVTPGGENAKRALEGTRTRLVCPSRHRPIAGTGSIATTIRRLLKLDCSRFARVTVVTRKSFRGLLLTKAAREKRVFQRLFRAKLCRRVRVGLGSTSVTECGRCSRVHHDVTRCLSKIGARATS